MSEITKPFCELVCQDTVDIESCKAVCEPCSEIGIELWKASRSEESKNKKFVLFALGLLAIIGGGVSLARRVGRKQLEKGV